MKRGLLAGHARAGRVLVKEFTQLTRDRLTYAMILAMPVVQLLLFGYAINNDPRHLPTAVLVQDHGRFARSMLVGAAELAATSTSSHQARTPGRARPR